MEKNSKTRRILFRRRINPSLGKMADNPHGATHLIQKSGEGWKLKKSIYFGILLYIQWEEYDRLSVLQNLWITNYARRCSDEELLRAGKLAETLKTREHIRFFHSKDILRVRKTIPWIESKPLPEAVRIGKGYTDKGSLRPLHERGRILSEIKFWDEDIIYMLPFDYQVKGEWITADEVKSLVGVNLFELLLTQVRQGSKPLVSNFNCRYV
jgi:hypothetical protein